MAMYYQAKIIDARTRESFSYKLGNTKNKSERHVT
jgi:hypothetical protein